MPDALPPDIVLGDLEPAIKPAKAPRKPHITGAREPLKVVRDTCSKPGAERLARELDAFWHSQGHPEVQHGIEKMSVRIPHNARPSADDKATGIWVVRSNLMRGLPPRKPGCDDAPA
jgi:hypothetical protein